MAKAFGFSVLPSGLVTGTVEDQPAATFLFYANLLAEEAKMSERLQVIFQRKQQSQQNRRR